MDEPSTGLDARATDALAALIANEKQMGAITVVVSHELDFLERVADRTLHIDRGRFSEPPQ